MVKIVQVHRRGCWRNFCVKYVLKREQIYSRLKSGGTFPGWGTKSFKVLPENREDTQNVLTETTSIKGIGKETNKEWWVSLGLGRESLTPLALRRRRKEWRREGDEVIGDLEEPAPWCDGPWKNPTTSTTGREKDKENNFLKSLSPSALKSSVDSSCLSNSPESQRTKKSKWFSTYGSTFKALS